MDEKPFRHAPPVVNIDGLQAVPIDITNVTASFIFDAATQTATADATMAFVMSPATGHPIFDLRQTIIEAWLDGVSIAPSDLDHHDFGGGLDAELRIAESSPPLAAGSSHTLRVRYNLTLPQASTAGSYQPQITWNSDMLIFGFGFTDLGPGRYLESWLPANLIYDQFGLDLDIEMLNSSATHVVITNGSITEIALNHWAISFPDRFTSLSHLLEIRTDTSVESMSSTQILPTGNSITAEVWKLSTSSINLATMLAAIHTQLATNESSQGRYIHEGRFVALIHTGGMEYDGGTTTSIGALNHELFHSWWGRGIKPGSQNDGWWDEAWTVFSGSATSAVPLNFGNPPVELSSRNPWNRITPSTSYSLGVDLFEGIAQLVGVPALISAMNNFYEQHAGSPVSTEMLEGHLLATTGNPDIVDAFHRFVYGFEDPSGSVDLWLRDDTGHLGNDYWSGQFWDSPDLWIRNNEDDGTSHESPEFGQDNWFYARVRNRGSASIEHFAVTFNVAAFAGIQFAYKDGFLPCVAAGVGFNVPPGGSVIVKARWPGELVPPEGSHACLLASVITRGESPIESRRVWEHNNLAQKNLTVVDLAAGDWVIIPFVIENPWRRWFPWFRLDLIQSDKQSLTADLLVNDLSLVKGWPLHSSLFKARPLGKDRESLEPDLDCGYIESESKQEPAKTWTSRNPNPKVARAFEKAKPIPLYRRKINLPFSQRLSVAWRVQVPKDAKAGEKLRVNLVHKNWLGRCALGGLALEITVKDFDS